MIEKKQTELNRLSDQGYTVLVSEMVTPDTVFAFDEPRRTVVFHPLNYSYLAYADPFVAHEINNQWIQTNVIDRLADEANRRLDRMVKEMNLRNEPRIITFLNNVSATENDDGSFTFYAQGSDEVFDHEQPDQEKWLKEMYG